MIKGLLTAMITPFKGDEVDYDGFRDNLLHQLEAKVEGVVILGTTAEEPTLTEEEKRNLIEIAVSLVKGKIHLMVGVGSNSTKKTLLNLVQAKQLGADSALVVAPYYNRPNQEGLIEHVLRLHEVGLPLCLYNIPKRCGISFSLETLATLTKYPLVVAIKDCSGDISFLQELIITTQDRCNIFSGDDHLAYITSMLGGSGLISVASNLIPSAMHEFLSLCLKKEGLEELHELFDLFQVLASESNPLPIKAAMQFWQMPSGNCRLPLTKMQNQEKLHTILKRYGRLRDTSTLLS